MSIVARYLLREFLLASSAVLGGLMTTWVSADTLLHVDDIANAEIGTVGVLVRALEVLPFAIPLSCVIGAVWSLTRAVRFREITAIRCGGVALQRALLPLLAVCILIGGGLGLIEDRVLVPARRAAFQLDTTAESESLGRVARSNGRFWYSQPPVVFSAQAYDQHAQTLLDVTVIDVDERRRITRRIEAEAAHYTGAGSWQLSAARVWRFDGDGGPQLEYMAELPLEIGLNLDDGALPSGRIAVERTSLRSLARAARDHAGTPAEVAPIEVAFHARLAQPLSILVLVLLALPSSIRDAERGDSLPRALLASLGSTGLFFAGWLMALLAGGTGAVPPAWPVWGVMTAALAIGLWRYRGIHQ